MRCPVASVEFGDACGQVGRGGKVLDSEAAAYPGVTSWCDTSREGASIFLVPGKIVFGA